MPFVSLPDITAGDFGRESWADQVKENFDDHEARIGSLGGVPAVFTYDLGGSDISGFNATSYTRLPGARPFFLQAADFDGYDLDLVLTRWTEDAGDGVKIALVERDDTTNIIAEMASASTDTAPTDDVTVTVTPPVTGIYVVLAGKQASGSAYGHGYGQLRATKA